MRVPRGAELSDLMEKVYNHRFSASRANAVLRALGEKGGIFKTKKRVLLIDEKHLITEPESARYVLKALEWNRDSPDGRVTKAGLHGALWSAGMDEQRLDQMHKVILAAGYLAEQDHLDFFRPTDRAEEHEPYLKKLVEGK